MWVNSTAENLKVVIEPEPFVFAFGLIAELLGAAFLLYCGRFIFAPNVLTTIRVGRAIIFLLMAPAIAFITPYWTWVIREVISLSPEELQLRREFWRFGATTVIDRRKLYNIRLKMVSIRGYRHSIALCCSLPRIHARIQDPCPSVTHLSCK